MNRYQPPVLLTARHQLAGCRCRSQEQTGWLVDVARQAHGTGTTRVFVVTEFVVTEVDQLPVVAYYAWCMASVAIADLPERLRRGGGRYPQPLALLARLGVDEGHEGEGLGAALLVDVITRVASLSEAIGCRGLLVHAESEEARGFYEHLIPEFERSPTDPLHLLLLLKDIRRTLRCLQLSCRRHPRGSWAPGKSRLRAGVPDPAAPGARRWAPPGLGGRH